MRAVMDGGIARAAAGAFVCAVLTVAAGCSGHPAALVHGAAPAGASPAAAITWLCRPGAAHDPCEADPPLVRVRANGARTLLPRVPRTRPGADCFYVYPTVSQEPGDNADLRVQPAERRIAIEQASRFSQVCQVWAPMYRQRTVASLKQGLAGAPKADAVAFASVDAAWHHYLARSGDRPFVLIGHSQGAAMVIRLIRREIDGDPALRARMISAIVLGGNVQRSATDRAANSFTHIPPCSTATQQGCVIAYSTFPSRPPADAAFGRAGQGISAQAGMYDRHGTVVCVDPTALGRARQRTDSLFLVAGRPGRPDHWAEYVDRYHVGCRSANGATWLQVSPAGGRADVRPTVTAALGPAWGFHLDDVSLLLGNLVADVRTEVSARSVGLT